METKKRGTRCHICTGCGLCPGVTREVNETIHVLAEDGFLTGAQALADNGERLAVADIGTTTIAMLLYGKDGAVEERHMAVNPQVRYGADVLSRIQAAEDAGKAEDMKKKVLEVLTEGILKFRKMLAQGERLRLVYAANTAMTYLLQGHDIRELGRAPFTVTHLQPDEMKVEGVDCFGFPSLSAFVGGDILAGMLACGMEQGQEKLCLLIDLGTNGELVLGNGHRRIACSTAAGPAFEGGPNRGVWGADMISILAALKREGCMDETGLLSGEYFERGIRVGNVLVKEEAVRSIQLAKAAVAAGIEVLLQRYKADAAQVDRVILAGGFGYYLNPRDAAEIGLLPLSMAKCAVTGGNTALRGCLTAGREIITGEEAALRARLNRIIQGTEVINLAEAPSFTDIYIDRMNFSATP